MVTEQNWWDDDLSDVSLETKAEWDYVLVAFAGLEKEGWHRVECPRCYDMEGKKDGKQSLGYNTRTGGYNCFKCGMHGSLPSSYRVRLLEDDPVELKAIRPEMPVVTEVEIAEGYLPIFEGGGLQASVFEFARKYIQGRGIKNTTSRAMQIGASMHPGKLFGRAIVPFPDYDDFGPWRGWFARDATGKANRPHLYSKGFNRIGYLYNQPALSVPTDDPCFVVEGALDVAALWPDAVAVLGKPLESHIQLLMGASRPVVICLDGDAWQEGEMLALTLRHGKIRAGNIRLPPKTDPDEVERSWLNEMARRSLR